jgi:hypothetical protein
MGQRRPFPSRDASIGSWEWVFTFLSMAAVLTNVALFCFTVSVLYSAVRVSLTHVALFCFLVHRPTTTYCIHATVIYVHSLAAYYYCKLLLYQQQTAH